MVSSAAKTVKDYVDQLPEDRRAAYKTVLSSVKKAMPKGYEEGMLWGMPCWHIPLKRYPDTYNGQPLGYVALAAQKNAYSLYLMGVYGCKKREAELRAGFEKIGKKPDMGKACIRFRKPEDIPLEVIAKLIASVGVDDYIEIYEKSRPPAKARKS